jgi:phosphonate transport system permease protein
METQAAPPAQARPAPPEPEPGLMGRLNVLNVTLILFLLAVVFSAPGIHGSGRQLNYLGNFLSFAGQFFPPDLSVTGQTLRALLETFQIAVMATFVAVIFSIPLAAAGAQNIAPAWLVWSSRMLMNVIRTIPSLIWALLAVAVVGANPLAGVIALSFYSLGYLGKFFSEAFESVDLDVARGLRAIGAGPIQAFQHGLWPNAKPLIWSYSLWMVEYNIRSAAIIGYVGAGGVGVELHAHVEYYEWAKFAAVLLYILVAVTLLDLLGERVRKAIMRKTGRLT